MVAAAQAGVKPSITLSILVVEDDPEHLKQLQGSLPDELLDCRIYWDFCPDFDEALILIQHRRYDLVVTDVYRGRVSKGTAITADSNKASSIIDALRSKKICPVVAYSDGPKPDTINETTFVKFLDKANPKISIEDKITEILETGVPQLARRLHNELDQSAGSYLWDFIEAKWSAMSDQKLTEPRVLERLIRRRAAVQLGHLDPTASSPKEIETVDGVEFYIYPPITGQTLRLGEILRRKSDSQYFVAITPHCHLVTQPNEPKPRADFVLAVKAIPAEGAIISAHSDHDGKLKDKWQKPADAAERLRKYTQSPSALGKPSGRHWFLPGLLDLPDLFCDFLQIESIPEQSIAAEFDRVAVLASPFAESLQACFGSFLGAVGVPVINTQRFENLIEKTRPAALAKV